MVPKVVALCSFFVLVVSEKYFDYDESVAAGDECQTHDEFPDPKECCARPEWIDQFIHRPCKFITTDEKSYQSDRGTCTAKCGQYRTEITLFNYQVQAIHVAEPVNLADHHEPHWVKVVHHALVHCKQRLSAMIGRQVEEANEMQHCEKSNKIFQECLGAQIFKTCPTQHWTTNDGCEGAKAHLVKGCTYDTIGGTVTIEAAEEE
ncbi:general odorant-binding protein 67-like [Uranotaenia lowii]|uniref:general odorant-binding protein 67-like n=1 Tax=Uranotaenia lowii TaxID=190385 RepID=UPI00247843F3|nr:general odorant-binding protein 67-like [Uranotaenia lowii]